MREIRELGSGERDEAIALVREVFEEFVRPDLAVGGWAALLEYVNPVAARERAAEHVMLASMETGGIVGVLEIREHRHISLLAVDRRCFRCGIARQLLDRCVEICLRHHGDLDRITVHSSRHALDSYRHLGFVELGEEMVVDGIRFTPMGLDLSAWQRGEGPTSEVGRR